MFPKATWKTIRWAEGAFLEDLSRGLPFLRTAKRGAVEALLELESGEQLRLISALVRENNDELEPDERELITRFRARWRVLAQCSDREIARVEAGLSLDLLPSNRVRAIVQPALQEILPGTPKMEEDGWLL